MAIKPPPDAYNSGPKFVPLLGQDKVLKYCAKTSRIEDLKQKVKVPESFCAYKNNYTFSSRVDEHKHSALWIQCDNGSLLEMPDKEMFVTEKGIVFYDPAEIFDTRVLPDTDCKELCKFSIKCNRDDCKFAHPFVCTRGVACKGQCKFFHPKLDSVVPIEKEYPLNMECKYLTSCSNSTCMFAHPRGRLTIPRHPARVFITHTLTLEKLPDPIPMKLDVPVKATCFQFQGEFVFFFVPYRGTWAKEHYQHVMLHRFDAYSGSYRAVGSYSLDGHYCNSVAGLGRYIVISFWPYEEEAIRTVWEGLRVGRAMEKELKTKTLEIRKLESELETKTLEIRKLENQLQKKESEISQLKGVIFSQRAQLTSARSASRQARQKLRSARAEQRAKEAAWRQRRQDYERARMDRFRLRDPIHIYALQAGCSGFVKEDWRLVLDYHKGAHDLKLRKPSNLEVQRLEITEHDTVYHFDLVVPADVCLLGALPLVPGRLCQDF